LESTHGWNITSSSSNPQTLTLAYRGDLQLFLHPASFPTPSNRHPQSTSSAPISLSYIGDTITPHPRPLTTTKRFFLQLLRAHLHCLNQSQTPLPSLLGLISRGWDRACAVEEGARKLRLAFPTTESITGDETMVVETQILLTPALRTKVKLGFEIGAAVGEGGDVGEVKTEVRAKAEVVYGQRYNEEKMGLFLESFAGKDIRPKEDMGVWADAVRDLRMRLIARGRKD
jgi:kinetochore protein Spc7/SPC105